MTRILNSQTEQNLNRLQLTTFCALRGCTKYKKDCNNRIKIGHGQWLCNACSQTPVGKLLQGDSR